MQSEHVICLNRKKMTSPLLNPYPNGSSCALLSPLTATMHQLALLKHDRRTIPFIREPTFATFGNFIARSKDRSIFHVTKGT